VTLAACHGANTQLKFYSCLTQHSNASSMRSTNPRAASGRCKGFDFGAVLRTGAHIDRAGGVVDALPDRVIGWEGSLLSKLDIALPRARERDSYSRWRSAARGYSWRSTALISNSTPASNSRDQSRFVR
jgi:hypothetical protein